MSVLYVLCYVCLGVFLVAVLARSGHRVVSIRPEVESLEQVFLEVTK